MNSPALRFALAVIAAESLQALTVCIREGVALLWVPSVLAFVGLLAGALLYRVQRAERPTSRERSQLRRIWWVAILVITSEHLTLIEFSVLVRRDAETPPNLPLLASTALLLVLSLVYAFRNRERFGIRLRDAKPKGSIAARADRLTVFLSSLSLSGTSDVRVSDGALQRRVTAGGIEEWNPILAADGIVDRANALAALDETFARSWSQPLRAIAHQVELCKPRCVDVIIIPSAQSACQTQTFATLLRRFFTQEQVSVRACAVSAAPLDPLGIKAVLLDEDRLNDMESMLDFDDIDMLWAAMNWLLPPGDAWPRASDREIMVDLTGGTKVTSVVGALITVDRDVRAQYVETRAPGSPTDQPLKVKSYDLGTRERGGIER